MQRGIAFPGPAVLRIPAFTWTPLDIGAALVGYIDFEDNAKVTTVSGKISQVLDTVSAAAFVQAIDTARPLLVVSALSGRQVAQADGTDDELTFAGIPTGWPSGSSPATIVLVGSVNPAAAGGGARNGLTTGGTSVNNARSLGSSSATLASFGSVGQGADRVTLTASGHGGAVWTAPRLARLEIGASASTVWLDGVAQPSSTVACLPNTTTTRTRLFANCANTAGALWWGELSAALMVAGALTSEQANNLGIWGRIRNGN